MSDIQSEDHHYNNLKTGYDEVNNSFIAQLFKFLKEFKVETDNFNFLSLKGGKWLIPQNRIPELYNYINRARQTSAMMHFAEPQSKGDNTSCLFLDFDIYHDDKDLQLEDDELREIIDLICDIIRNYFNINLDIKCHCLVTKRKNVTLDYDTNKYRHGFHIIFSIRMKSSGRNIIIDRLMRNEKYIKICDDDSMEERIRDVEENLRINFKEALDRACAWVPVLVRGAARPGKVPHEIAYIYSISIPSRETAKIRITCVNAKDISNICHEFSINHEMYNGTVKKQPLYLKDEINALTQNKLQVFENNELDCLDVNSKVNITCISDVNAKYVKEILDIIDVNKLNGTDWRKILMTIMNQHVSYKMLAEQFSRKSEFWDKNGFDKTWELLLKTDVSNFSIGTLLYYAKKTNVEGFTKYHNDSVYDIARVSVLKHQGDLNDHDCAVILKCIYGRLYVNTIDVNDPKGSKKNIICRFITPNDKMREGEVWKWRVDSQLADVCRYIYDKLENVFDNIKIFLENLKTEKEDALEKKKIAKSISNLNKSCKSFGMNGRSNNILAVFTKLIMDETFLDTMDKDPYIIGVGNGILELGNPVVPKLNLIDHYHNYRISKYTPVMYRRYDPDDPYIQKIEKGLSDIIIEEDSLLFILCMAANCLNAAVKDLFYLFLIGVGANGKSTLLELITNCLGHMYAKKYRTSLITSKVKNSESANSANVALIDVRLGYTSEVSPGTKVCIESFKGILSGEKQSGRGLFKDEMNFKLHCHHIMTMNDPLVIDCNDHGTWRRIGMYKCKSRFLNKNDPQYDPENKYHKEANPDFQKIYPTDPNYLSAMLSVLTKYYIILYEKYEGCLFNIHKPTIDFETQQYRNSQDSMNEFITKCVVRTKNESDILTAEDIAVKYREWYATYRGEKTRDTVKLIAERVKNSILCKFFETSSDRSDEIIKNIRILASTGDFKRSDEEFIIQPKLGRPKKSDKVKNESDVKSVLALNEARIASFKKAENENAVAASSSGSY